MTDVDDDDGYSGKGGGVGEWASSMGQRLLTCIVLLESETSSQSKESEKHLYLVQVRTLSCSCVINGLVFTY